MVQSIVATNYLLEMEWVQSWFEKFSKFSMFLNLFQTLLGKWNNSKILGKEFYLFNET